MLKKSKDDTSPNSFMTIIFNYIDGEHSAFTYKTSLQYSSHKFS